MGGIPASRITQFVLGNKKGIFPIKLNLYAKEKCHIRHTSLESARITANRSLERGLGNQEYKLTINVYPHEVLTDNP